MAAIDEATAAEAAGQRLLLAGDPDAAAPHLAAAAAAYRSAWELGRPVSVGRLSGLLKAAVLAGDVADPRAAAAYALAQLPAEARSPSAAYVRALAAAITGDGDALAAAAEAMRTGDGPFERAADALAAIAARDATAFRLAVEAIVADFAARPAHLTGVAIADTAAMLQRLGATAGVAADVRSPLLPPPAT